VKDRRATPREIPLPKRAFSAASDTSRAYRWLAAYSPRAEVHFQLHLHREPSLAWLRDPRYRSLLAP
jgi:hypothetical protein